MPSLPVISIWSREFPEDAGAREKSAPWRAAIFFPEAADTFASRFAVSSFRYPSYT